MSKYYCFAVSALREEDDTEDLENWVTKWIRSMPEDRPCAIVAFFPVIDGDESLLEVASILTPMIEQKNINEGRG